MVMRVEHIGDATLYLGDCRDILPLIERADALVTDPPYGYGKPTGTIGSQSTKRDYLSFDDTPENVRQVCVPAVILSLEKTGGRGAVTTGNRCAFYYPIPEAMGCFFQPAATGMCTWGRSTSQPILFYGKDPRLGKTIDRTSRQMTEPSSYPAHPCAKPLEAWSWIVWKLSLENEIVLDPFMGSGTTGVCCANLGRKFIGIESEPAYFDMADQWGNINQVELAA
jgi:site-specific DNA-methyltransferase (adenine-specific)/modification methylase